MKNQAFHLLLLGLGALGVFATQGCSTSQVQEKIPPEKTEGTLQQTDSGFGETKVEIDYLLGRDHYRYMAQEKNKTTTATTTLGGQVIAEGPVDHEQYNRFLKNAISFLQGTNTQQNPIAESYCRSPYKLTIMIDNKPQMTQGCRSAHQGALSKLIKEGEFLLLYSKN